MYKTIFSDLDQLNTDPPTVSIVIVNWNGGNVLEKCLMKANQQTFLPTEIIVVDNASSDGSEQIAKKFKNVTLLRSNLNLGFAGGNNLAIKKINTKYIALINPDVYLDTTWLERLIEMAEKNLDVAAFGSRQMVDGNSDMIDGLGDVYHISGRPWRDGYGLSLTDKEMDKTEIFSPCAGAALYRTKVMKEVGGFDEDYFCYVEDVDLGFRLRLAGYRAMLVKDAVVNHVGSATTGGQDSDFALYHGHRNLVWTFVKDMPGVLFWLLLPLHLALNVVSIIWFSLRGRGRVILQAKRDALLGLPKMWRKRKYIQKNRVASIGEIRKQLDKRMIFTKSSTK